MPKNRMYQETKLIKRKKYQKKHKWLFPSFIILSCIALVIMGTMLFSNVVKVGNFSFLFGKTNESEIKKHSYYFVTMGNFDNLSKAQNFASEIRLIGASGYVWKWQNKFFVVGGTYKKLSDAQQVVKNNVETKYKMEILEIPIKKLVLHLNNFEKEQKQCIISSLNFFDELFNKCYDYSIKLDKKEISTTFISSELNALKSKTKIYASKIDAINTVDVSNLTILIKNSYINLIDIIENSILKIIDGESPNSDLKYLVAEIIAIKYKLFQNI